MEVREEPIPPVGAHDLLVQTELTAISAGTEMLLYRGQVPSQIDAQADRISDGLQYPTPYGYAAVGRVVEVGSATDRQWLGRQVFGFQPHTSHFVTNPESVLALPAELAPDDGVFLPNTETAVNLVQDAAPILGERVLVMGQGVVGLLSAAFLQEFPLDCLVTVDRYETRRTASAALGVAATLDPGLAGFREEALRFTGSSLRGYDLTIELTGNPAALNDAIALTTYTGRIVVGSWFGMKTAPIDLGGRYHRSRIKMLASQVSTIAPELSGRWDKERRFQVAWEALKRIRPGHWITDRFQIEHAAEAYGKLDTEPGDVIQVVFTYA